MNAFGKYMVSACPGNHHPCVSVQPVFPTGDPPNFLSVTFYLAPDEARRVAREMLEAADELEGEVAL